MTEHEQDSLMRDLAALPVQDVEPWRRENIRVRAQARLAEQSRPTSRWLSRLERLYGRSLEPAVVVGLGGVYLLWAFRSVVDLLG